MLDSQCSVEAWIDADVVDVAHLFLVEDVFEVLLSSSDAENALCESLGGNEISNTARMSKES